jgi:hypothetical protein
MKCIPALFEDMLPAARYIDRGGVRPSFANHLSALRLDVNSDAAQLALSQKGEKDAIAQWCRSILWCQAVVSRELMARSVSLVPVTRVEIGGKPTPKYNTQLGVE